MIPSIITLTVTSIKILTDSLSNPFILYTAAHFGDLFALRLLAYSL